MIITDNDVITLGTLTNSTVLKQDNPLAIEEDFRLIKLRSVVSIRGMAAGEVPILLGLADNELSVSEIAEAISANGPLDRNDRVSMERAERPVWLYGAFSRVAVSMGLPMDMRPLEEVVRWTFSNPEGWCWFVQNRSGGTLTTGAIVEMNTKYYGVWVT